VEEEGAEEIIEDSKQGHGLRIRFISKILLLSIIIIVFPPQHTYGWECEVTLDGPNVIKVGQPITLTASGTPEGGSYSWSRTRNLVPNVPNGKTAQLTGFVPTYSDYIRVIVTYTTERGKKCSATKWIWVCICYVKITGPSEVKAGETITLTAEGEPSDGTYSWTPIHGLEADGRTAQFTGQSPGDVTIEVTYTTTDEETCNETHTIKVSRQCSVPISGPSVVGVGNAITLTASGNPGGGTYIWAPLEGLVPGTSSATFSGQSPGDVTIEVAYTTPDGETCNDTHDVTAFGVGSITGPVCVKSETTLTKEDFTIVTNPPGFDDLVIVSPVSFSTLSQSEEVTVTAYSGTGAASDEATTTITVVNSNVKNDKSVSFEIPNLLNEVLKKIALGEKTDLSVKGNFKDFKECCEFGMATSLGGNLNANLSVDAGPFTIIGIPLPPKAKKWVAADLLNVALSGGGNVGIDGSYKACEDNTDWSGAGNLTAGVELGGEVTVKVPQVIILKGEIKGSTSITEKLSTNLRDLTLTTNWGGLTGLVSGKIRIFRKEITFEASETYFEQDNLLPVTIPLPALKQ
jgi:hypothetical protein